MRKFVRVLLVVLSVSIVLILVDLVRYPILPSQLNTHAAEKYGGILDADSIKSSTVMLVPADAGKLHLVIYARSRLFNRYRVQRDTVYNDGELNHFANRDNLHVYSASAQNGNITIFDESVGSFFSLFSIDWSS